MLAQARHDLTKVTSLITRTAIIRLLGAAARRGDTAARDALKAQIARELESGSGLYTVITPYLSPDDIRAGLPR